VTQVHIEDLDSIDWKIVNELLRDGRVSLVELGRKVGLSHPSVKVRLSKLIKRGLIKVQANINVTKLGLNLALINVEVEDLSLINNELETLRRCLRVILLMIKSGNYNLTLLTAYRDVRELEAFIERRIRRLPKVKRISVETIRIAKPIFIPWLISLENNFNCVNECENCNLRKRIVVCPGCIIRIVARGDK